MDWQTAEIAGYRFYKERGYQILVKLVDNSIYDFVIEKDGKFQTVNVKVARYNQNGYRFSMAGSAQRKKNAPKADIYLVYLIAEAMFVPVKAAQINSDSVRVSFQQIRSEKQRQRAFRLQQHKEREERQAAKTPAKRKSAKKKKR